MSDEDILQYYCANCSELIHEPFIDCCECNANICTTCFSAGREFKTHKNNHKFAIRRNDFPLFDNCNWSAKEESKLLSALSIHGYGNWEEIAKSVHTRSKLECQEHYKKYYIEQVQCKELELLPETLQSIFPQPVIPFLHSNITSDPPRSFNADQQLAGYNPFRSEFELSYDNNAESIFNIETDILDDEDDVDNFMDTLKVALVRAFNTRLKERHRRYKIMQNHGLIMPHKLTAFMHRFENNLLRLNVDRLLPFVQFMTGMQFDAFMYSMSLEKEMVQRISQLYELRKNGVRTLHGGRMYELMKKGNEETVKEQKYFTSIMVKRFEHQSPGKSKKSFKDIQMRYSKKPLPLDIVDLPGFYLLSNGEKELCSSLRLIPQNYLEFRELLITENHKMGSLRLLDARRIVKIDVNKTRKIYDYLVSEGIITKPK